MSLALRHDRMIALTAGNLAARASRGAHLRYYRQVNLGVSHAFTRWGMGSKGDYPTLRFDITNVFDTVYEIRNGTGVGVGAPQFGPRRGFFVGMSVPF